MAKAKQFVGRDNVVVTTRSLGGSKVEYTIKCNSTRYHRSGILVSHQQVFDLLATWGCI